MSETAAHLNASILNKLNSVEVKVDKSFAHISEMKVEMARLIVAEEDRKALHKEVADLRGKLHAIELALARDSSVNSTKWASLAQAGASLIALVGVAVALVKAFSGT